MTDQTHVWVKHEETGGVWACPAEYLPIAELRGWEPVDAPDDSLEGLFDPSPLGRESEPEPTGFDPDQHTVKEVQEHIAKHRENAPGEVERVLELERAGQNRTTITGD
jgi:hypothetical protein